MSGVDTVEEGVQSLAISSEAFDRTQVSPLYLVKSVLLRSNCWRSPFVRIVTRRLPICFLVLSKGEYGR